MHLCTSHVDGMTSDIQPGTAGIDEKHVAESAPMVRALVVQRLEQVWRACEPHINVSQEDLDLGFRRDPRYIEAGIRVLDRLASIYGLLKTTQLQADPDAGSSEDQRRQLTLELSELESRMKKEE